MLNSLKGLIGPFGNADLVRIMRGTEPDGQPSPLVSRMSPTW
jgi:hypothetical protein